MCVKEGQIPRAPGLSFHDTPTRSNGRCIGHRLSALHCDSCPLFRSRLVYRYRMESPSRRDRRRHTGKTVRPSGRQGLDSPAAGFSLGAFPIPWRLFARPTVRPAALNFASSLVPLLPLPFRRSYHQQLQFDRFLSVLGCSFDNRLLGAPFSYQPRAFWCTAWVPSPSPLLPPGRSAHRFRADLAVPLPQLHHLHLEPSSPDW